MPVAFTDICLPHLQLKDFLLSPQGSARVVTQQLRTVGAKLRAAISKTLAHLKRC